MNADHAIHLLLQLPYTKNMKSWATADLAVYVDVLTTIVSHAQEELEERNRLTPTQGSDTITV